MPVNTYITANGRIRRRITTNGGAVTDQVAVVTNALGSVVATYKDGWLTADRSYDPYGETRAEWNDVGRFGWVGGLGYRETRREWVSHYVRARHYGFTMGMWTSVDPLWPSEAAFGYVGGMPSRSVDYYGLFHIFMPSCEPCASLNATIIVRGEETKSHVWVHPGRRNSSLEECLRASRQFGRNCACVNGGFFAPTGPIGPVTVGGRTIPSVVLTDPRGKPKTMPTAIPVAGSVSGSVVGRPWRETPNAAGRRARTGACVDGRGSVIAMMVVPEPPGATAKEMEACMISACPPGTMPVSLDGGGSTQFGVSGRGTVLRSSDNDPRPVHNWFVICDG